jgi:hypothetical protein
MVWEGPRYLLTTSSVFLDPRVRDGFGFEDLHYFLTLSS